MCHVFYLWFACFVQDKLKPGSSTAPGGFQEICREQGMQMGLTKVRKCGLCEELGLSIWWQGCETCE